MTVYTNTVFLDILDIAAIREFIEIFDNLGRLVYSNNSLSGEKVEINVSNLPIGTYVTRMFTQGKIAVQKFEKMN